MDRSVGLAPIVTHISCNRHINQLINTNCYNNISTISIPQSRTDLDSHADTCVVDRNVLITHYHGANGQSKYVNVVVYDPTLGSVPDMRVVNAAVAYDCPETGEVIIFQINQAIHINTMENSLLCNMQLRI